MLKTIMFEIYVRVASFPFSKRLNSAIFHDCNFWDFTQHFFLRIAMSDSAEISMVGLPIYHIDR